jgi:hypothetical protein
MVCGFGKQIESFILTCSCSEASEIIIRPITDGALIAYKHTSMLENWECVDDEICDNNTTMVWYDYITEASETYCLENISIPSEYDINSIVVLARNLCDIEYDTDMIYKLIITDNSECLYGDLGDVYESPNFRIRCNPSSISGVFGTVAFSWAENPRTGLAWTNEDINNLQIGTIKKSKIQSYDNNVYCWLGTSDDGSTIQLTPTAPNFNWECVTWHSPNTTYVRNNVSDTWQEDLYVFENDGVTALGYPKHFDLSYNIIRVRLYFELEKILTQTCKAKLVCKTHGLKYYSSEQVVVQGQSAIAKNWLTNPNTGLAWTWQEVLDAEFGIALWSDNSSNYVHAYEAELLVIYDKAIVSEIATSQIYAKINLTAYHTITAKLPKPSNIPLNQNIETKSLNFQSGNRKTYGLRRSGKRLIMTGLIWDGCVDGILTAAEIITNIKTMAKYLEPVTISGLKYSQYNKEYNIVSFNPVQIQQKPNLYEWELTLEFCE